MKNLTFLARMGFASRGIALAWRQESSIRIQSVVLVLALLALVVLMPAPIWWALFALAAAMVLGAEVLNSAIERLCDLVEPEQSEAIRDIKDIAAGAVMVIAIAALLIAIAMLASIYG